MEFIENLRANFSLYDPVRDVEHQVDHLFMKDGQPISKYVIKFNHLASQVYSYGQGPLCHVFYNGMPDCIKDEISHIDKPATLQGLCTLAQTINGQYWEHKSELTGKVQPASSTSTLSTYKSASLTLSSASSSAISTISTKKVTSLPSTSAHSATPATPTHLDRDSKLTEEEYQWHFKEKFCKFCGQPGHMAKDCPKSSSKDSKARAVIVTPVTSTPAPLESEN